MGDYLGLSSWALNAVTSVLAEETEGALTQRRRHVALDKDALWLAFEMEERGLGPRCKELDL